MGRKKKVQAPPVVKAVETQAQKLKTVYEMLTVGEQVDFLKLIGVKTEVIDAISKFKKFFIAGDDGKFSWAIMGLSDVEVIAFCEALKYEIFNKNKVQETKPNV